jgi:hypothetical protein
VEALVKQIINHRNKDEMEDVQDLRNRITSGRLTISQWGKTLNKWFGLSRFEVGLENSDLIISPYEALGGGSSPKWWQAYNHLKHSRHEKYREANMENALSSLAGLFILIPHYPELRVSPYIKGGWRNGESSKIFLGFRLKFTERKFDEIF